MRTILYSRPGTSSVLELVDREPATPGSGEVRVHVAVSEVNPTDGKSRVTGKAWTWARSCRIRMAPASSMQIGADVTDLNIVDRVWLLLAAHERPTGTTQEFTVVPAPRRPTAGWSRVRRRRELERAGRDRASRAHVVIARTDLCEDRIVVSGVQRCEVGAQPTSAGASRSNWMRHRRSARCEDRIRHAKDTGHRSLTLHELDRSRIWCRTRPISHPTNDRNY